MSLTANAIYSFRFAEKLALTETMIEMIAKLRAVPAKYTPIRGANRRPFVPRRVESDNWRESILKDCVRKVRERTDPDQEAVFSALNKVVMTNIDTFAKEIVTVLKKNDETFRMRVSTLLFNKAITESAFAVILADMAKKLTASVPEIAEDLEAQVNLFHTLQDMNETIVFPSVGEEDFDDKVVLWFKQKDKRRGYARFLTQLQVRDLVSSKAVHSSVDPVLADLFETARKPLSGQTEENIKHFADFLQETAKILPPTAVELRGLLHTKIKEFLAIPKTDLPSLGMRSRFKLEDAMKCVH